MEIEVAKSRPELVELKVNWVLLERTPVVTATVPGLVPACCLIWPKLEILPNRLKALLLVKFTAPRVVVTPLTVILPVAPVVAKVKPEAPA